MKKFIGSLALAAALTLPAHAENTSVDYSDLWWNPAHSGWGLGLQRQADVMFATLFIYGNDGTATWLFASDVRPTNDAATSWTGKLFRSSGPAYSAPFDSSVSLTELGTLRIDFGSTSAGSLTYTMNGATVVEPIQRITFRAPSLAGGYTGGVTSTSSLCQDEAFNGDFDLMGAMNVTQAGSRVSMAFNTASLSGLTSSCTFTGDYAQSGRLGKVQGTFRCSLYYSLDPRGESSLFVARLGNFTLDDVSVTANGFAGKLTAKDQDCSYDGRLGAVRLP